MVAPVSTTVSGGSSDTSIAAIVVSYRSAPTLDSCLTRLRASTDVSEIAVVDNASDDASVSIAQRHAAVDPRVSITVNLSNAGFGEACNQGARGCGSSWIAFVNPDCWVETDSLARLRDHLIANPEVGLVGADLVDAEGVRDPAARRFDPTLARLIAGAGQRSSVAIAVADGVPLQTVDATSGALMLLSRAVFESLAGFDEHYRLHAEDLDLCRRVRDAGLLVGVANDVQVIHLRGVSSRSRPWFVEWHKHRGMWRYFRKFEGSSAGLHTRAFAFAAIWAHFAVAAPRAWLRSIR